MYPTKKQVNDRLKIVQTQLDVLVDCEIELIAQRHKLEAQINLLEDEKNVLSALQTWTNNDTDDNEDTKEYTSVEFVDINDVL
jgi:hypothetical protein